MVSRYTTAGSATPSNVANGRVLSDNNDVNLTDRYRGTPSSRANGGVLSDNNDVNLTDRYRGTPSSRANGGVMSDNNDVNLTDRYRGTPSSRANGGVLSDNNDVNLTDRYRDTGEPPAVGPVEEFCRTTTTRIGECSCDAKGRRHVGRQTDHGSVTGRSEPSFLLPSVRCGDAGACGLGWRVGGGGVRVPGRTRGQREGVLGLRQIACNT